MNFRVTFYLSLFSLVPWDDTTAGEMMEVLFDYVLGVSFIPEKVFDKIKAFFKYYNSLPNSELEKFWNSKNMRPAEIPRFHAHIKKVQRNLLDRIVVTHNITTVNDQRTNTILIQMCMMIYIHPEYQNAMEHIENGTQIEQEFQLRIMELLLVLFYSRSARFDLNDDHFVRNLRKYMHFRKNKKGNGQNMLDILMYVIKQIKNKQNSFDFGF